MMVTFGVLRPRRKQKEEKPTEDTRFIFDFDKTNELFYNTNPQNKAIVDRWTVKHFFSGLGLGLMQKQTTVLAENLGWELFEVLLDRLGHNRFHEPLDNKLVDILAVQAGSLSALGLKKLWNLGTLEDEDDEFED